MKVIVKRSLYFIVGVCIFILIYGTLPLDVTYDSWILNGYIETDIIQRYAGWIAYRNSNSIFPLTFSQSISFPFGDYTSLADSIPAAEVIFKLFDNWLPETFQFCGLLACFNMGMQCLTASMLLNIFTDNEINIFAGSLLFTVSPVMLERLFRHTSLSFHWILVLAIYLYFKSKASTRHISVAFLVLSILSVWLHLYFAPMVIGLFLAYILDKPAPFKTKYKDFCLLALSLIGCVLSMNFLGILQMNIGDTIGYGSMGMNLNALFNPVSLDTDWWVPGKGKQDWSLFLPVRALALNNLESFNYLGLGVILSLLLFGIYLLYQIIKFPKVTINNVLNFLKTHLFLILFAVTCTVFAVSNNVCAFSYQILSIPLPEFVVKFCNPFRASGRLFWAVNYLLVLLAIVHIIKSEKLNKNVRSFALILILVIQLVDLSPVLIKKHNDFSHRKEYYNQAVHNEIVNIIDGDNIAYFLYLKEDRALSTTLLKNNISNNLWLINRESYGVEENKNNISDVTQSLLNGISPYNNCTYISNDINLVDSICSTGNFYSVYCDDMYFIKPIGTT